MMDPENLSKLCGIKKSYLQNITNVENEVLTLKRKSKVKITC